MPMPEKFFDSNEFAWKEHGCEVHCLHSMEMTGILGLKGELDLLEFVLSNAPVLGTLSIQFTRNVRFAPIPESSTSYNQMSGLRTEDEQQENLLDFLKKKKQKDERSKPNSIEIRSDCHCVWREGGICNFLSLRMATPSKSPHPSRSQISEGIRFTENRNPNISSPSPSQKSGNSQPISSAKSNKSAPKEATARIGSFQAAIQERRFVIAKKKSKQAGFAVAGCCRCKDKPANFKKCPCVAYENLRASQEEFFRVRNDESGGDSKGAESGETGKHQEPALLPKESESPDHEEKAVSEAGSSKMKRIRNKLLEQARNSIPESGKVMHLVKAFESILSIPTSSGGKGKDSDAIEESTRKVMKWALPGLQGTAAPGAEASSSAVFSSSNPFGASKNFDADSRVYSSLDGSIRRGSYSIGSRTSDGGRRSRRNSSDSSVRTGGKKWEKQLKVTGQHPFKLRTEQRGRFKKEEFQKKVEQMMIEEKKQRIPIAQGLPWTTDEPERLVKPPVKESTMPIDLMLRSDVRAVERADFDHQVAEKLSLMEQYKIEKERQLKMEEEEEIRRLRKELVPRAQPMPYFDRPFIPKRSMKHPTIPKEPKFHIPQHKKIKCMSWNDINFNISTS
ncbi:hypothetical protein ACLOJK_035386 [Asimina triloba]